MQTQYTKTGETKHSVDCNRVFNRYDKDCPRCQELIKGDKPRDGWQKGYYANKKLNEIAYEASKKDWHCEHGIDNLNPGGYCNICGKGRDFS